MKNKINITNKIKYCYLLSCHYINVCAVNIEQIIIQNLAK